MIKSQTKTNKFIAGFTLIELLVLFSGLGLLLSIFSVSVGYARSTFNQAAANTRDGRRILDINQLRTGLEVYLSRAGGYPDKSLWVGGSTLSCSTENVLLIPDDPGTALPYIYKGLGNSNTTQNCGTTPATIYSSYQLQFTTEGATYLGPAGNYCLTPSGISRGSCPE